LASLTGISPQDATALRVVRDAMIAFPQYVAGTGQFDTALMEAGRGEILSKGGAEGVHAVAVIPEGIGFVAKVTDGAGRARGPSSIAALRRLNVLDASQERDLARFARPAVYNRAGNVVGEIVSRESV
jgi:L-asparaginase II